MLPLTTWGVNKVVFLIFFFGGEGGKRWGRGIGGDIEKKKKKDQGPRPLEFIMKIFVRQEKRS